MKSSTAKLCGAICTSFSLVRKMPRTANQALKNSLRHAPGIEINLETISLGANQLRRRKLGLKRESNSS